MDEYGRTQGLWRFHNKSAVISADLLVEVFFYEIFKTYGLNVKGNNIERLASVKVDEIPFIEEMKEKATRFEDMQMDSSVAEGGG